jgi:fructose-bisphosphate aldolase, class II
MKVSILASLFLASSAVAFVPVIPSSRTSSLIKGTAEELGIPCEDECAIESYPNLPPSVHPGVLSGKAQMDLLRHAKENGEFKINGNLSIESCPGGS